MPHARAKIVDRDNVIVPIGRRGELCIAGYQLHAGYWNNSEKTAETLVRDKTGVLWLYTGDEAVFDEHGYCTITGRIKDIIIRGKTSRFENNVYKSGQIFLTETTGGENIYPLEIEERLMAHHDISRAIVVGLKDSHYGEVVSAFLQRSNENYALNDDEVREWTRQTLGRHKAPAHIFWLGEKGVPSDVPLTGSGKVRKFEMAKFGEQLLKRREGAKI